MRASNVPILVAGGGGGKGWVYNGIRSVDGNGNYIQGTNTSGSSSGNACGGASFTNNSPSASSGRTFNPGAYAFVNGGVGGSGNSLSMYGTISTGVGGFGCGGGTSSGGGGGGGYSGGNGGAIIPLSEYPAGAYAGGNQGYCFFGSASNILQLTETNGEGSLTIA